VRRGRVAHRQPGAGDPGELDATLLVGGEILSTVHEYADRTVELHFFSSRLADEPRAVLGQEMAWVHSRDFGAYPMPPADDQLVGLLVGFSSDA